MTATSSRRYRARSGLLLTGAEGAQYLTDIETGEAYELNQTAVQIFAAVSDGLSGAEAVARMTREYGNVAIDEIERDVHDTLERLLELRLLELRS